jgi:hypothetical protein
LVMMRSTISGLSSVMASVSQRTIKRNWYFRLLGHWR